MILNHISLLNFKNYAEIKLDFSHKFNCFVGDNGEGKTNLLDAIYYLSFTKSFFNAIDGQNIKHDEEFLMIQGVFGIEDEEIVIDCSVQKGQKKKFRKNKKEYKKLADHVGKFPSVMVSPADSELILGGSDIRRKFIDKILSQTQPNYLRNLIDYNKLLQQRNALLKRFSEAGYFDETSLEIWDEQLEAKGKAIFESRKEFLEVFKPVFLKNYETVSGNKETVELVYQSQLFEGDFLDLLKNNRAKDRASTYTSVGVHKDDLELNLGNMPIKKFGSQGQQKTYLLALKLAQFEFIKQETSKKPMLLLDDIFDKLDSSRVEALMGLLNSENFGQVFISDTSRTRVKNILEKEGVDFEVFNIKGGNLG